MTSEKTIVNAIKKYLEHKGLIVFKLHGSPMQQAGLPDLLAIRYGRALWFEVKKPGEKPTKLQEYMLKKLRDAACLVAVVTSVEEVEAVLAGRMHP